MNRVRRDRCPGVLRPWIADDGALVRLRLAGAPLRGLNRLLELAEEYGDGALHLTSRANVQLRGVPHEGGAIPAELVDEIRTIGLLPQPSHELVRNIEISPMTGRAGGRADLRPIAAELDRLLCAEPNLASLPGRFLFVLDDGRGDIAWRSLDLGLIALDSDTVQLRIGEQRWAEVLPVSGAAGRLAELAARFQRLRGDDPDAPWHVDELPSGVLDDLGECVERDPRAEVRGEPWPHGEIRQHDGRYARHLDVPYGRLTRGLAAELALPDAVIVTPWRSVIVPDLEHP